MIHVNQMAKCRMEMHVFVAPKSSILCISHVVKKPSARLAHVYSTWLFSLRLTEMNKTLWELLLLQMQVHLQTLAELNSMRTIARYYLYKSGVQWKGKITFKQWRYTFKNEGSLLESMVPWRSCKGKVTQKWKFCHQFLTLKLFQTFMSFMLLLSTKKIFWRMLITRQLTVAIDFHNMEKIYYWGSRFFIIFHIHNHTGYNQ